MISAALGAMMFFVAAAAGAQAPVRKRPGFSLLASGLARASWRVNQKPFNEMKMHHVIIRSRPASAIARICNFSKAVSGLGEICVLLCPNANEMIASPELNKHSACAKLQRKF
jgi:hypothetical protein